MTTDGFTQQDMNTNSLNLKIALEHAARFFNDRDLEMATTLCQDILRQLPGQPEAIRMMEEIQFASHIDAAMARFPGEDYQWWLPWFHNHLMPKSYIEIGVESGASIQHARADCKALGIDPALNVQHSLTAWTRLFKLTSDDFFFTYDPREITNTEHIDFAFIDGLHTFDQALKDFINIEQYAGPDTVVLFHDIFPVAPETAERDRITRFWVGDTWKVIPLIRELRPDLNVFTIPTRPSGLGVITRCDPNSRVLRRSFDQAVSKWKQSTIQEKFPMLPEMMNLLDNNTPESTLLALERTP